MSKIEAAKLRKAKNIRAGDEICFAHEPYNFIAEDVEHREHPDRIIVRHGGNTAVTTFEAGEYVYLLRPESHRDPK